MTAESAVVVAVRSRPLLDSDGCGFNSSLKFFEQNKEIICQDRSFTFNYVFPPDSSNLSVYKTAVSNRLNVIFDGYNLTVFAYGQTGSGKSHTMGTSETSDSKGKKVEDGIIPLSVTDIFNEIYSRGSNKFNVKASFLEVYKEEVYDLLNRKGTCKIQEDIDGSQKVANLTEITVKSLEDVLSVLHKGCQARRTGSTALNEHSSRSHSIFSLIIEQNLETIESTKSKFQLVDLAGSERAERSRTEGERFKEGVDINKGLLALGKIFNILGDVKLSVKSHIPYRDSKLTRLLMDSLGGNCYTLMIACISPSELSSEETLSTLRYATSVQNIKNKPVVNVDPPHVQIEKLKRQVEVLQSQLYSKGISFGNTSNQEDSSDIKQQKDKLQQELSKSSGKVAALSEELMKAEEKAENLNRKLKSLYHDLTLYFLNQVPRQPSPELDKILEHLKSPKYEDLAPNLAAGESDSPEREVFEEEDADSEEDMEKKLGNIDANLKKKQEMMEHCAVLSEVVDWSEYTQDDLNIMNNKIKELEQEKINLQEKLKTSEKRFADECQKRFHECSCEIYGLKKKILKNEHIQKIKVENQMKLEKFKQEIKELKCSKVKLMKKMQKENENFRKIQMANQREVAKLKQKERKKDQEIYSIRSNWEKRVNVLTQKLEKYQNLAKKHKEALEKRDGWSAFNKKKQNIGKENLKELLNKELEVEIFSKLASEEYNFAKENVSDLAEKIQLLEEAGEVSGSLQDLITMESEKLDKIKPEIKCIPGKKSERWAVINNMTDAKVALDILFDKFVSNHIEVYRNQESISSELSSLRESIKLKDKEFEEETKNFNEKLKSLKQKFEAMKDDFESKLQKERYERDIAVIHCLKDVNKFEKECARDENDSSLLDKLQFQEQEIQRLNDRFSDYTKKCEEAEHWKQEYYKQLAKKGRKYLTDFHSQSSSTTCEDITCRSVMYEYLDADAEDSFTSITDSNDDPDWRMTPVQRQRKRPLRETALLNVTEEQDDGTLPSKRPFSGCKCPGDCKTMRCACKKKHQACCASCGCNQSLCVNVS